MKALILTCIVLCAFTIIAVAFPLWTRAYESVDSAENAASLATGLAAYGATTIAFFMGIASLFFSQRINELVHKEQAFLDELQEVHEQIRLNKSEIDRLQSLVDDTSSFLGQMVASPGWLAAHVEALEFSIMQIEDDLDSAQDGDEDGMRCAMRRYYYFLRLLVASLHLRTGDEDTQKMGLQMLRGLEVHAGSVLKILSEFRASLPQIASL